jgi:hypothetical protein
LLIVSGKTLIDVFSSNVVFPVIDVFSVFVLVLVLVEVVSKYVLSPWPMYCAFVSNIMCVCVLVITSFF